MQLTEAIAVRWQADGQEGWGRFLALSPLRGRVVLLEAPRPERLFVSFSLAGEAFSDLPCALEAGRQDEDGYARADLLFLRPEDRRRLRDAIARLLMTAAFDPRMQGNG